MEAVIIIIIKIIDYIRIILLWLDWLSKKITKIYLKTIKYGGKMILLENLYIKTQ